MTKKKRVPLVVAQLHSPVLPLTDRLAKDRETQDLLRSHRPKKKKGSSPAENPIGPDGLAVGRAFQEFCSPQLSPGFHTDEAYGDFYCDEWQRAYFLDEKWGYYYFDYDLHPRGIPIYFDEFYGDFYLDEQGAVYFDEIGTFFAAEEGQKVYFDAHGLYTIEERSGVDPHSGAQNQEDLKGKNLLSESVFSATTSMSLTQGEFSQFYADRKMGLEIVKFQQIPIPSVDSRSLTFTIGLGHVLGLLLDNKGDKVIDKVHLILRYTRSDRTLVDEYVTLGSLALGPSQTKVVDLYSLEGHINPPENIVHLTAVVDKAIGIEPT